MKMDAQPYNSFTITALFLDNTSHKTPLTTLCPLRLRLQNLKIKKNIITTDFYRANHILNPDYQFPKNKHIKKNINKHNQNCHAPQIIQTTLQPVLPEEIPNPQTIPSL